ncbi:MAG: hypothetical protein M3N14_10330 [Bacteroidota bacterium]|nr:hypothetical protein [Bacteroidota bacterium]
MSDKRYTHFIIIVSVFLFGLASSCQKDPAVRESIDGRSAIDSSKTSFVTSSGNYLAIRGILKVKIKDSTYTFDASHDSIAFINVHTDENRFFGITAINKDHTLSFGISATGFVNSDINGDIAGGQLLLSRGDDGSTQFSLSQHAGQKDFGKINIIQYNQNDVLARGTFFTFLSIDDRANSPAYRVDGTFELFLK